MEKEILGLFDCFGFLFVVIIVINAVVYRVRGMKYIKRDPSLRAGYNKIAAGFAIGGSIPFLFLAFAMLEGGAFQTIFSIFSFKDLSFLEMGFWGSVFLMDILLIYWVFFRNGAESFARHPGFINIDMSEESRKKIIKFIAVMAPVSQIAALMFF